MRVVKGITVNVAPNDAIKATPRENDHVRERFGVVTFDLELDSRADNIVESHDVIHEAQNQPAGEYCASAAMITTSLC